MEPVQDDEFIPPKTPMKPVASGGLGDLLEILVAIPVALAVIALLIAGFLGFLVLRLFWVVFLMLVDAIGAAFALLLQRIVSYGTILLVGAVLTYAFFAANQELSVQISSYTARAKAFLHETTGFSLPSIHLPSWDELKDILTSPGSGDNLNPLHPANFPIDFKLPNLKLPEVELPDFGLKDINLSNIELPKGLENFSLEQVLGTQPLPKELTPLLGIPQDKETLKYFKYLADSGLLQEGSGAAVPILSKMLYDQDPRTRQASYQSLHSMQSSTPSARKALRDYQKVLNEVLKDAYPRR